MGLIVSVYRSGRGDCSNGGFSSNHNEILLENVPGPFEPDGKLPVASLVAGNLSKTCKIVAAEVVDRGKHVMFGGNFAYTSDSRFGEAVAKFTGNRFGGAVSIHDRIE